MAPRVCSAGYPGSVTTKPLSVDPNAVIRILRLLRDAEIQVTVIGGQAVGAYAAQTGTTVMSGDVDVYGDQETQRRVEQVGLADGARVAKRPKPRGLSTLVLDWDGVEVDVLTKSSGPMPSAEQAFKDAWQIDGIGFLDPFQLLRNKLALRREKDVPHIAILRRFLDEHVESLFTDADRSPRDRIAPAQKLLDVLETPSLPAELYERLASACENLVQRRFLISHAPSVAAAEQVANDAPASERGELGVLVSARWSDDLPG